VDGKKGRRKEINIVNSFIHSFIHISTLWWLLMALALIGATGFTPFPYTYIFSFINWNAPLRAGRNSFQLPVKSIFGVE
jgi:hypothetical protein